MHAMIFTMTKPVFSLLSQKRFKTSFLRLPFAVTNCGCLHSGSSAGLNNLEEELNLATKIKIENHWKNKLKYEQFDQTKGDKFYVLSMFPYPSGNLHMGHIRVYSISDTLARFYRMNGKNVLHPMGWDAFGLPAENAAIERGLSSADWTASNIATMKAQLERLGCTFDWSREITTCRKNYYKFTQALFLKMYHEGLVYQKKALVNWDPVDQTVLADEQVDETGRSWRSGAKVEKKALKQWFIRTTSFANSLYDGLHRKDLEDWKDIIDMQKQWIGVCDGVSFEFPLKDKEDKVILWTDKPQLLTKAEFIAVPCGSLLDLESGGGGCRKLECQVVNLVNGRLLPVYVAEDLPFYEGSDGRVGIPSAYECDLEFAHRVGLKSDVEMTKDIPDRDEIIGKIKGRVTSSKLRDWLISRQRHWGTPIPVVHCDGCGAQPVPIDQLPVELPPATNTRAADPDWIKTTCPKCGGPACKDQDTMDTFVDSSWYFLRFIDPNNTQEPFAKEAAAKLMPVDVYIGGKEHAVLHLYYARFMSHFLHSVGWLPDSEPFQRLVVQGMVLGRTFKVKATGKFISEDQVQFNDKKATEKGSGEAVSVTWDKMSKSKHNGVDPGQAFDEYGVDTTRLLIMATVSPTSPRNWDSSEFAGVLNWQRKVWLTVREYRSARQRIDLLPTPADLSAADAFLRDSRNYHLQSIAICYKVSHQFNRVIAKLQGLIGDLRRYGAEYKAHSIEFERALALQIVAIAPLAPHFAAELWAGMQEVARQDLCEFDWSKQAHLQPWPEIDDNYNLRLTCWVNSSVKDSLKISRLQMDKLTVSSATQLALSSPQVRAYTDQAPVQEARLKLYPGVYAAIDLSIDYTLLRLGKEHHKKKEKHKKRIKAY